MYDFSFANLWDNAFPAHTWRRLTHDVLEDTGTQLSHYIALDEPGALAKSLARYLHEERGVRCMPEQIVFGAGTDGVIALILQLFCDRAPLLGMEEPGYLAVHQVAHRLHYELVPLPVGNAPQEFANALETTNPTLIYTTPSRQFPTGLAMPDQTRAQVLDWAEQADAYVIEDDNCWEYRFDDRVVPCLQSQDTNDRVIYVGNMSKVLSPGMRIAYAVLPPRVLERYRTLFSYSHAPVSHLEAEVLSRFIDEGLWLDHLETMRAGMKLRHDTMVACLSEELGDIVSLSGVGSGMHLFATVDNGMGQEQIITSARDQGALVYGAAPTWFSKPAPPNKVILGFSSFDPADIPKAVGALTNALT